MFNLIKINFDFLPLIKYLHSSWISKKLQKRKFDRMTKQFVYDFNLLIEDEQDILFDLLTKESVVEGYDANNYIRRLEICGFLYKIPNSNIKLKENKIKKAAQEKFIVLETHYSYGYEPYLYALTKDTRELLQYLYDSKLIFQDRSNK